jgi:3-phenylpropionate/trans-cinnamate dioxygenase ferredoxin reductase subunit
MKHTDHLLIGGGLASHEAAVSIRERNPDESITIVSKESYPPYNRTMLSKAFLRGEADRESLYLMQKKDYDLQGIELLLDAVVEKLEPETRKAGLPGGDEISFDGHISPKGV